MKKKTSILGNSTLAASQSLRKSIIEPRRAKHKTYHQAPTHLLKLKVDFHDGGRGGHLGLQIGTIWATFDLQVTLIFPTE